MSLIKHTSTIAGFTAISRVFGFVRDMLFARILGAGLAADAFQLAFTLPNTFRRLFAEGAFSVAFVPMYSRKLHGEGGAEEAERFSEDVMSVFVWVLAGFSLVLMLAMPGMVWLLAREYQSVPGKFELSVYLSRITFPYLALVSVVSLFSGMLNAQSRFAPGAVAPVLFNITLISGLLLGYYLRGDSGNDVIVATVQSWALPLAGIAQLLFLWWSVKRAGFKIKLHAPRITADVKKLAWVIFPATFGAGIYQISQLVDTFFATSLPQGSLTLLKMADRLNQMPLGIVGIALGTAILPAISRQIAKDNIEGAKDVQGQAMELATLLTIPSAVALAICAPAFVNAFFVGGKFTAENGVTMAHIVMALVAGLPAYVLVKVLEPGYFARGDTRTPVMTAATALTFNIILNIFVVRHSTDFGIEGIVGLAAATACSASLNCILLYINLHRRDHFRFSALLAGRILRQFLSAAIMGVLLYFIMQYLLPNFSGAVITRIWSLIVLVGAGGIAYFVAAYLLGAIDRTRIDILLRRKPVTAGTGV
jgi:putative peptidoglycan lipid II flippase